MTAKIIVIVNQKGGAGKTTVTINLAGSIGRRGYQAAVIDGDEQSSVVEIVSLAPEDAQLPASVIGLWKAGRKIHQEIKKFIDLYDYIIVDCPPAANSPIAQSALLIADIAIVPFIPGTIDALAAPKIRDAIEAAQVTNPELKALLLLNRVEPGWSIMKNIIELLPSFKMPMLRNRLNRRAPYVESPGIGNSVHQLKDRKEKIEPAVREVEKLTDEILAILKGDIDLDEYGLAHENLTENSEETSLEKM